MRPCGNLSAYANVSLSYDILLLTHMNVAIDFTVSVQTIVRKSAYAF